MIGTVVGIAVVAVLSIALLVGGAAALYVYIRRNLAVERNPREALELRVAELELQIKALPSLWEEERKRAKRAQGAANAARRDVEEKLEQIEAFNAETGDLRPPDEAGFPEDGVLPVRTNMGTAPVEGLQDRAAAVAHLMR